jgi:hypothetical protein
MGNSVMLVLGGFVLVGIFMLSTNSLLLDNSVQADGGECFLTGLSIAQSVIDEAKMKTFDQKTVSGTVSIADSLTAPSLLGRDGPAEVVPIPDTVTSQGFGSNLKFNDVDDYNGYTRSITTTRFGPYFVSVVVQYASPTCPDSVFSSTKTFCKVMTATVTGTGLIGPVSIKYAFTY